MKIILLVIAYCMLCGFQIETFTVNYPPENYLVCEQLDVDKLNSLLEWESSKTTFESSSSVKETVTNSCNYQNKSETLEISVNDSYWDNVIISADSNKNSIKVVSSKHYYKSDGHNLTVAPGSFDANTGEITYEYFEVRNFFKITMRFRTKRSYDLIENLFSEFSKLIEFKRKVVKNPDMKYEN